MVGVLSTLLGVGVATAGRGDPARPRPDGTEVSSVAVGMALPETIAEQIPVGEHISAEPACPQALALLSPPNPSDVAMTNEDLRAYLSTMAALRVRRQGDAVIRSDPYQASLNPAVYVVRLDDPRPEKVAQGAGSPAGTVCFPPVANGDAGARPSVRGH